MKLLSVPFLKYFFLFIITATIFFVLPTDAFAVACTSAQTGNWNTSTTWGVSGCVGASGSGGNTPGASDTVTITSTHNVTVTANVGASSVAFGNGVAASTGTLTINSGVQLTVTNGVTLRGLTGSATSGTIQNGTGSGTITAASLTVGDTGTTSNTAGLSTVFTSTVSTFTISGGITTNCQTSGAGNRQNRTTINLSSGSMSVGGTITLCDDPGTQNIGAQFQMNQGSQNATLTNSAATPWSVGADAVATLNGTSAAVNYSGAAQAIHVTSYTNLTLSGSGTATGAVTSVSGDLTVQGSVTWTTSAITTTMTSITTGGTASLTVGANTATSGNLTVGTGSNFSMGASTFTLSVSGTTDVSGTLANSGTGQKTYIGAVTINSGGSWTNANNGFIVFRGGLTNNSAGTVSFGTGLVTFTTNNQALAGSQNITFGGNVAISGNITITNDNTATVSITGTLDGNSASSRWTQGTNSTLAYGNTTNMMATAGLLDASTNSPNTVSYNADGNQTVFNPNAGTSSTYDNLTFGGTGANRTKTADFNMTVNGNLTIGGQSIFAGGTSRTHTFKGNWVVSSTASTSPYSFTTNGTVTFDIPGTPAATSISGSPTTTPAFSSVNINNTSGFSISTNISAAGTITVASNVTVTPSAGVVVSGVGSITGTGTIQVTKTTATADLANQYTITTRTLTNLTVDYAGASAQTLTNTTYGSGGSGGLKISCSSCMSTGAQTATVGGVFNVTGTFTPSSATITMNDLSSITNSGTLTFFNLTTANSAGVSTSSSFTISSTFTIGTSSTFTHSGGTITLSATGTPFVATGTYTASGGATINYTNTTSATVTGVTYYNLGVGTNANTTATTFTLGGNTTVSNVLTIGNAASSVANDSLDASTRTLTLSGTNGDPFIVTAWGNFTESTSTVEYTGDNTGGNTAIQTETYYNLNLGGGSAENYAPEGAVTVTNDLTLNANGTLSGSQNVTVNGNVTGSGAVNLSGGTFEHLVALAKNFGTTSGSTDWTFNNLKFNNSSGTSKTITVASGGTGQIIISGTLTLGDGGSSTVVLDNNTNDRTIDANGAVTIGANGSFTSSSSTPLTIAGSFSNSGTFTHSNGAVTFDGASQTFTGNTTFYDLAVTGSTARTVTFTAGSITSVASGGSLLLTGAAGNLLTLQSSGGTDWLLQVANNTSTDVAVAYVSVSRSNAAGFKTIAAYDGTSTNGGNNTNWVFTQPTPAAIRGGSNIRGGTAFGN